MGTHQKTTASRKLRTEQLERRYLLAADFSQFAAEASAQTHTDDVPAIVQQQRGGDQVQQLLQNAGKDRTTTAQQVRVHEHDQNHARDRDQLNQGAQTTPSQQSQDRERQRNRDDNDSELRYRPRTRESFTASVGTSNGNGGRGTANEQQQAGQQQGGQQQGGQQQEDLSQAEIDRIFFVREEEKLARDVYLTLGQSWNVSVFDNIAESEQNHMDAMKTLIDKYDLVDPVTDDTVGVFTNQVLQQLYDHLTSDRVADLSYLGLDLTIEGGVSSELAALKVGAFVEEWDIVDIMRGELDVTHSDVESVYDNLLKGSRNHLRSFVSLIESSGASYEPVLMTGTDTQLGDLDALYLDIVASDRETGKQQNRTDRGGNKAASSPANDQWFTQLGKRSSREGRRR